MSLSSYASSFKNASVSNTEIDALDERSSVGSRRRPHAAFCDFLMCNIKGDDLRLPAYWFGIGRQVRVVIIDVAHEGIRV